MVDMETGLRGCVIAGKEAFLEPYVAGQLTFEQAIAKGLSHVSDNPIQIGRLQKIQTLKEG
jgi:methyl-accepting chemotaxis protein